MAESKKTKPKTLSKSSLMKGFQCEKYLWLSINQPEAAADTDAATQMQFDEGNEVGELARKHAGVGVLIQADYWDYKKAHDLTEKALADGETLIFEASFLNNGIFARVDILKKDKKGWHLIEVKKASEVKEQYYQDAAIQSIVIESTGLNLASISIRHINTEVTYPDLKNIFGTVDITKEVRAMQASVNKNIKTLLKVALATKLPEKEIGPYCSDPYGCPFKSTCWKNIPKKSIFALPGVRGKKVWELYNAGKIKITDLDPKDFKNNTKRAIEVTKSNKLFVDKSQIKSELATWKFPLYFFDFETINPAIPRYEGTHPYGKIPFQFSCYILESARSSKLKHFEYLHTEASDPRAGIIKAMLDGLGAKGSIVSYNKVFEIGVIKKLAEQDKKNRKALLALVERFVDPLPLFRSAVYHPEFYGSFSIKEVAPALIGEKLNYKNLTIGDGSTTQAFAELILRGKIDPKAKNQVVEDMLAYCRQDTMAMVELFRWLQHHS
ncbi:MAG: DUF2779 domain-containing protein [Moraxellaceae bacterium]|nr:DUF2779 domain-containing protein [Pseudobdellovibrionaceae bacterium]